MAKIQDQNKSIDHNQFMWRQLRLILIVICQRQQFKFMNLSSLTSDNQDQSISSFFNESCNSVKGCCEYRSKYKEVYKDLSTIRIELRNLKNHDENLKNSLEGMQEQVSLLQQILNAKKQMITKLNFQLTASNEQINRLEDQINQTRRGKADIEGKFNDATKFIKELQMNLNKQRQLNQTITARNDKIQKEVLSAQQEHQKFKVKVDRDNKKVLHEKSQIINNLNKLFENHKKDGGLSIRDFQTDQIINSREIQYKVQQLQSNDNWSQLNTKIIEMIQQYKKHEESLISKDVIITQLTDKNTHLQSQINSSLELFQQQMKQLDTLKKQAKQKEAQHLQTITRQNQAQKQHSLVYLFQSIVSILRNTFYNDNSNLLDQILGLAKMLNNKFEVQVILNQMRSYSEQSYNQILKQRINTKQCQKLIKDCKQFQQNYQVLHLKFRTLERSYREVIQDNNRLIKFNHLTQYRINRNISPQATSKTSKNENSLNSSKSPYLLQKEKGLNSSDKQNMFFKHNS